jgi:DNA-binding HxlR family transcriptional regulator
MMKISSEHPKMDDDCKKCILSAQDTLEVLDSRWKFYILILLRQENRRFNELSKSIRGITPKVLSKELKELEANQLINRVVYNLFPPHVEYSITDHGTSLDSVFISLMNWGDSHRKKIIKQ